MNFSQKTYPPPQMLLFRIFWSISFFFRFCPIVKSMISLYKLNGGGAGPISFHKF